jgi:hypothetical protein
MRTSTRVAIGLGLLAAAGWLVVAGTTTAAQEKETVGSLEKIAKDLSKGDKDAAVKQAKEVAGNIEDVEPAMHIFKLRVGKNPGVGVGTKAQKITPDGIEDMIRELAQNPKGKDQLQKEAKALEQLGYRTAAVMEVALQKVPEKDNGNATRKLWIESATTARDAALKLAKAAHDMDANAVMTSASKANTACTNCHTEFKQ